MFKTELDMIMYISKQLTNGGFDKNKELKNFTLSNDTGIFGTTYYVSVTLEPMIGPNWSIQLGKTICDGTILASENMGRISMSMSDIKKEGFVNNIDGFIYYIFNHKEIKMMLRKKKLKKLKENVRIF